MTTLIAEPVAVTMIAPRARGPMALGVPAPAHVTVNEQPIPGLWNVSTEREERHLDRFSHGKRPFLPSDRWFLQLRCELLPDDSRGVVSTLHTGATSSQAWEVNVNPEAELASIAARLQVLATSSVFADRGAAEVLARRAASCVTGLQGLLR